MKIRPIAVCVIALLNRTLQNVLGEYSSSLHDFHYSIFVSM